MSAVYDLLVFHGFVPNQTYLDQLYFFEAGQNGEVCTGVVKLAQRWLLEFLTEVGSMPFQLNRGCSFLTNMRYGRLINEDDVQSEFQYARMQIAQNLVSEQTVGMSLDEQYADVALTNLTILGTQLQLNVTITSQAGTTMPIIAPVSLSPLLNGV